MQEIAKINSQCVKGKCRTTAVHTAIVVINERVCREHYRLTFRIPDLPIAEPGQFVHLSPMIEPPVGYRTFDRGVRPRNDRWLTECSAPLLRRAFSIAGLSRTSDGVDIVVIYRVVGKATRWMESLEAGDHLSVLGPLGNCFPISERRPVAWLIGGGVGLPPMLWLAEALHKVGKRTVAFCGARTADLFVPALEPDVPVAVDAARATLCCREFARSDTATVISTDDGSLGFHGHIGAAMRAYHASNPIDEKELVVYCCGPEPMMRLVSEHCLARDIECHLCMERAMACGTGLCQSCVVPVRDEGDLDGWSYRLCCTDGPIFDARCVIWEPVGG